MRLIWRWLLQHFWAPLCKPSNKSQPRSSRRPRRQLTNGQFSLTESQLSELCAAASTPREQALIRLFVETGLRRFEAGNLKIPDIDFAVSMIFVANGKGNKSRLVPMTRELAKDLRRVIANVRTSAFVFQSRQGKRLSPRQINRIVARIGERAGLRHPNPRYDHISCHLLRHSFARRWKDRAGDIETLSMILGHASVKTTWDVYGKASIEDMKRDYRRTIGGVLGRD